MKEFWKVGEVAAMTGLTIRTLRYYDQIHLFSPSQYTDSGHRLYTQADLIKLQQILALKQMGLGLDDIQKIIANKDTFNASDILETQIAQIKKDIEIQQKLLKELENTKKTVSNKMLSVEELAKLFSLMKWTKENYFTKEQLAQMKQFYENTHHTVLRNAEQKFQTILVKLRNHLKKQTPASHPDVQKLSQQWQEHITSFSPSDPALMKAAEKYYAENPENAQTYGMDADIYQYIQKALQRAKE